MGKSIIRACDWCKKPYKVWESYAKRGDRLCCSRECSGSKKEHNKTPDKFCIDCGTKLGWSAKYSPERNIKRCVKCFTSRPLSLKTEASQFQKGLTPWNKGLKGFMAGEQNNFWRGGISKFTRGERENIMSTMEYRTWRVAVFERDQYACQDCGQGSGKLEAHHIKSWTVYPELRLEITNGQTLCKSCHREKTNKEMKVLWSNQYQNNSLAIAN